MTETDTITGYKNGSITLKLNPKDAMIKENSPIWQKQKPDCIDVLRL